MADPFKSRVSTTPEHKIHDKIKSNELGSYEPKRGPFDFDMKSVWQRDAEEIEDEEKKEIKLAAGKPSDPYETPQSIAAEEFHGGKPYFTMPAQPKNEALNFSKLMSGGYGDDWRQQHDEWEEKHSQPNDSETSQSESTQTGNE